MEVEKEKLGWEVDDGGEVVFIEFFFFHFLNYYYEVIHFHFDLTLRLLLINVVILQETGGVGEWGALSYSFAYDGVHSRAHLISSLLILGRLGRKKIKRTTEI